MTDPTMSRRHGIAVFVIAACVGIAWALATPLFGSPDETSHVVKAVGVVRGQPAGTDTGSDEFGSRSMVDVPAVLSQVKDSQCYAFQGGQVPADCFEYIDRDGTATVETTAGRHPPFYYAVVGIPSLVTATAPGVYAMRIVSALGTAAMLAAAWVCLGVMARPRAARAALAVAATPMVFYLGATVNPNGWEIAAAILLWCAGYSIIGDGPTRAFNVHAAGVGAVVLALTRQLGPVWLAIVLATLALLATRPVLARLWRRSDVRIWLVATAVAFGAQVAWIVIVKPLQTVPVALQWTPDFAGTAGWTGAEIVRESVGRTMDWFHQWIGVFGALDTFPPRWTTLVWTAAILGLLVAGIVAATRRELIVGALLLVAVLAIPIVAELREFRDAAFYWQGRYTMPLAVGLPILAGVALARHVDLPRRLALGVGVLLASAQALAFAQALRRYSAGADSEGLAFWVDAPWSPPVSSPLLIVVATLAFGAWSWLLVGPWAGARAPEGSTAVDNRTP